MVKVLKVLLWMTTLVVLILDQLSKYVVSVTAPNLNWFVVTIHLIQNTGAGFGIFQNQTLWLGLLSLIVALGVILNYRKIPVEKVPLLLWGLFLGGVIGNMLDRLFRGYVIDFIDLGFWPAFNVADAAITIAVLGLLVYYWKK